MNLNNPVDILNKKEIETDEPPSDNALHAHTDDILELLQHKHYMTALILLIGLGLHSLLEGLALGSSNNVDTTIALGIAIICHKYLAAFALGSPLFKSKATLKFQMIFALLFGSFTPIGIGVGWILASSFEGWISDLFVCIASGTFLYVAIVEIMLPEFSHEKELETSVLDTENIKEIGYNVFGSPFSSPAGSPRVTSSSSPSSPSTTNTANQSPNTSQKTNLGINLTKKWIDKSQKVELIKILCIAFGYIGMSILAIWA